MACPTCDHTMQFLGCGERIYWCPRCGTIMEQGSHFDNATVPKLVTRCREFEEALVNPATGTVGANLRLLWHTSGIDESIYTPGWRARDTE